MRKALLILGLLAALVVPAAATAATPPPVCQAGPVLQTTTPLQSQPWAAIERLRMIPPTLQ